MNACQAVKGFGIAALTAAALCAAALAAEEPPAGADDVEVLTRGPIHEAYAEPVSTQPQPTPIIPKKPPDPIEEVPSEQKPAGDDVQWIPGYWAWDDDRGDFLWVSGFWRVPPPDRQWSPGYWSEAQGGWQWTPGFWAETAQTQVNYLPPPPPSIDNGPTVPAAQEGSAYVPGNWLYVQNRYMWRPGFWNQPRAGWVWIPAHYVWTPSGYVFVDGYWDYALANRGLLFAPVYFNRPLWARPGWSYRPSYMVYPDYLMNALFVRPGAYSYYFGDYFDARYARLGYRSWPDYRLAGAIPDPLFGYYRWANRGNANWLPGLRQLYTGRFNGTVARPPHTFVEQNRLVHNINNRTVNVANLNHVVGVAPLSSFDARRSGMRLEAVTAAQRQQVIQHARQVHTTQQNRRQAEMKLQPQAPLRVADPARTGTLHALNRPANVQPTKANRPPPRPVHPMHESRPIPKYEPPRPEIRTAPKAPKTKAGAKAEFKAPHHEAPAPKPAAKKTKPPANEKKPAAEKKQAFGRGTPARTPVHAQASHPNKAHASARAVHANKAHTPVHAAHANKAHAPAHAAHANKAPARAHTAQKAHAPAHANKAHVAHTNKTHAPHAAHANKAHAAHASKAHAPAHAAHASKAHAAHANKARAPAHVAHASKAHAPAHPAHGGRRRS